jgi:hypothetical protein
MLAYFGQQRYRSLVARVGPFRLTKPVGGVPEERPGERFSPPVVELLVKGNGPFSAGLCRFIVAELSLVPAEPCLAVGEAVAVVHSLVELDGPPDLRVGFAGTLLKAVNPAGVFVDAGLAFAAAEFAVGLQCLSVVGVSVAETV